ncbi:hypothetical protein G7Y89_g3979 [Cudoniella acicularis]|uniref:Uncharacterized protein n=1 Tax=Cudoniella acicularis TaxID=354080 RepID=A0A8H4RRP3_9HELO|nr:hypothetical protein G7Y89_g3979 [Cudoniella acicularis]
MCIGISAPCMPALANLIRNSNEWSNFRSTISKTFGSLTTSWHSSENRTMQSKTTGFSTEGSANGPYSTLDKSKSYEMNGIRTTIRLGRASENDDGEEDVIRLNYGFRQEINTSGRPVSANTSERGSPV